MNKWSKRSVTNINTVHRLLQIIAQRIILISLYDIGVLYNGGKRDAETQNEIYLEGNSRCDGYIILSMHQYGLAIDFIPYVDNEFSWTNKKAFLTIAKLIFKIWDEMVISGESKDYFLHWGGFWNAKDIDNNGLLEITDKLGWDMAHYELRKTKQRNTFKIEI